MVNVVLHSLSTMAPFVASPLITCVWTVTIFNIEQYIQLDITLLTTFIWFVTTTDAKHTLLVEGGYLVLVRLGSLTVMLHHVAEEVLVQRGTQTKVDMVLSAATGVPSCTTNKRVLDTCILGSSEPMS